jgi:proteasome alpha subunit
LVATTYADGVLMVAENPSRSLHKISEIYDRIAFGGVGKYNEYDQLRVAGVRHADTKGFAFSREDVDARSLANLYAQFLGNVFTHEMKPLEVEILVAELGADGRADQLYHIAYEGTITDEDRFAVLGGDAETIAARVNEAWQADRDLRGALGAAVGALAGPERTLGADDLEVAVLSRRNGRRTFRRITDEELADLLAPTASSGGRSRTTRRSSASATSRRVDSTKTAEGAAGQESDEAAVSDGDVTGPGDDK